MTKADKIREKAEDYDRKCLYEKAAKCYMKGIKALEDSPDQKRELAADLVIYLLGHIGEPSVMAKGVGVADHIYSGDSEFKRVREFLRDGRGEKIGLQRYLSELRSKLKIFMWNLSVDETVRLMKTYTLGAKPNYWLFFYYLGEFMYKCRGNVVVWRTTTPVPPEFEEIRGRFIRGEGHNGIMRDLVPLMAEFSAPEAFTMAYYISNVNMKKTESKFYWLAASALDKSASIWITERYAACESGRGIHLDRFYRLFTNDSYSFPHKSEVTDLLHIWRRRAFQTEEAAGSRFASYQLTKLLYNEKETKARLLEADYPESVIEDGDLKLFGFSEYCSYGEIDSHPEAKQEFKDAIAHAEALGLPIIDHWKSEYFNYMYKNYFDRDKHSSYSLNPAADAVNKELEEYKKKLETGERLAGWFSDGNPLSLDEREFSSGAASDERLDYIILQNEKKDLIERKRQQLIREHQSSKSSSYDPDYSSYYDQEDEKPKEKTPEELKREQDHSRVSMDGCESWFVFDAPDYLKQYNKLSFSRMSAEERLAYRFEAWISEKAGDEQ